jgi:hypothetical protein
MSLIYHIKMISGKSDSEVEELIYKIIIGEKIQLRF